MGFNRMTPEQLEESARRGMKVLDDAHEALKYAKDDEDFESFKRRIDEIVDKRRQPSFFERHDPSVAAAAFMAVCGVLLLIAELVCWMFS